MKMFILFFLLGAITGGGLVGFFVLRNVDKSMTTGSVARSVYSYAVARAIRNGDTNGALRLVEGDLDVQITMIGSDFKNRAPEHRPAEEVRFLGKLRDYRRQYPRVTDVPEIDAAVSNAFLLVPTNSPGK